MSRKHQEGFFLSENSSKARIREAENARKNRAEIVKAYSQGKVSRRDLIKWGLITTGGVLAPIHGLNPFVNSAFAAGGVTVPPVHRPAQDLTDWPSPSPCFALNSWTATPSPLAIRLLRRWPIRHRLPALRNWAEVLAQWKDVLRDRIGRTSGSTNLLPRY